MNKIRIQNYLMTAFIMIIFIAVFTILITSIPKPENYTYKESTVEDTKYNINIVNDKTNNDFIDNLITTTIEEESNEFKANVDNNTYDEETSSLEIKYINEQLDNLFTIYSKEISTINNEQTITVNLKYYNSNNNEEITLDKLYTDKEAFYNKLVWYMNWYINRSSNTIEYTNKDAINTRDNYYIIFAKNRINILYKENTLLEEETIIPCPYTALSSFLNTETINLDAVQIDKVDKKDDDYYQDKKIVAFTFDDGPVAKNTNLLLDELEKRNYKVTFFVVGNLANNNRDVIKREYDLGHNVGTHTWSHTYLSQFKGNVEKIQDAVYSANNVVYEVTGEYPTFFRPPGGIRNQTILDAIDMPFILWSVDTRDWEKKNTELDAIAAVEYTKSRGDIVLFHDLHAPSIPAAIQAMDILAYDNFEFVNLETLLRLQNQTAEKHSVYRSFK